MHRLSYLLFSLAILAGCFGLALEGGQAAAVNRRAAPLLRVPLQFPIDEFGIFQKETRVGEIYSPGTDIKATQYVEHWVLYDGYIYPGKNHLGLTTTIKASPESAYKSEADFFASVPGGRVTPMSGWIARNTTSCLGNSSLTRSSARNLAAADERQASRRRIHSRLAFFPRVARANYPQPDFF